MTGRSTTTVGRWARGESEPTGEKKCLLSALVEICESLYVPDKPWLPRAWFAGMNPELRYETPESLVVQGDLADVQKAALSFVRGADRIHD